MLRLCLSCVSDYLSPLIVLQYRCTSQLARKTEENVHWLPPLTQAFHNEIHGPALNIAVGIPAPVHDGECTGKEFGGHAHDGCHPHPEDSSRASHSQCYRYPADIAHSDRCSQCTR